jgi:hypothetical protein
MNTGRLYLFLSISVWHCLEASFAAGTLDVIVNEGQRNSGFVASVSFYVGHAILEGHKYT